MAKITVKICSGTTCFIMGGNRLLDIADSVKEKYGSEIEIIGSSCLEQCSYKHSKAPFIEINGEILSEVTPEKLMSEIETQIEALQQNNLI